MFENENNQDDSQSISCCFDIILQILKLLLLKPYIHSDDDSSSCCVVDISSFATNQFQQLQDLVQFLIESIVCNYCDRGYIYQSIESKFLFVEVLGPLLNKFQSHFDVSEYESLLVPSFPSIYSNISSIYCLLEEAILRNDMFQIESLSYLLYKLDFSSTSSPLSIWQTSTKNLVKYFTAIRSFSKIVSLPSTIAFLRNPHIPPSSSSSSSFSTLSSTAAFPCLRRFALQLLVFLASNCQQRNNIITFSEAFLEFIL